ncbi:cell wall-binding repeat-containing protein [Miniphocaeibacter halophilus]|uniref:Cell wall-binding repeat-containing protein n=1 Tax=Miniphocaeibacter halophilus TaxID=2931922 RepID=A0AC61MYS9_9FIRM|nr:cell wall-binding repeat-containing protein [Miniphocaeibacter halophilus]QQK08216.1 cell wall-binding repeat-containing protein [Miniphocaeibacter halophilus]
MKKRFRVGSLALSLAIICGSFIPTIAQADDKVETTNMKVTRIDGADRIETAVKASQKTFQKGSRYVVLASGEKFADALVGGTLATQIKAPILLTGKDNLPKEVEKEILRLNPEKIFLLGGRNTISDEVEGQIMLLRKRVDRLAGKDRYETAVAIWGQRTDLATENIFIDDYAAFNGNDFADALAAAPFVGQNQWLPLIPYVEGGKPAAIVFGGLNSVPKTLDREIRYAGADRIGTAVEIAKAYKGVLKKDIDTVVLVDGYDFPDALASAPVASMNNGAVLLTNSKTLSKGTKEYIVGNKNIKKIIIVGGENSVSSDIEKELKALKVEKPVDESEEEKPTTPTEETKPTTNIKENISTDPTKNNDVKTPEKVEENK